MVDDRDEFVEHEVIGRDEFGALGRLILTDWANADAEVILTLRSGVQLVGRVRKRRSGDPPELVGLITEHAGSSRTQANREIRHDVLLSEVAAITAVATDETGGGRGGHAPTASPDPARGCG